MPYALFEAQIIKLSSQKLQNEGYYTQISRFLENVPQVVKWWLCAPSPTLQSFETPSRPIISFNY